MTRLFFKSVLLVFLTAILSTTLISCSGSDDPAVERARRAARLKGDIVIGAAGPWGSINILSWNGIEMAGEEINKQGGILGKKLRIIQGDDQGSVNGGQIVAQQFAEDPDMVAVIGHYNSFISLPASIIYEYYGLLMLSPQSTNPKLTRQGFKKIFRNIPDDTHFGRQLAGFCRKQGYKHVMIYHSKNDYGEGLANAFEKQCENKGIIIPDRLSYDSFSNAISFNQDLGYWKENYQFDTVFIAGIIPQAAMIIKEARKLEINVPFVGGDGLDTTELMKIGGESVEGTYVGAAIDLHDPDKVLKDFVNRFQKKYGKKPDVSAVLGYDAVMVLAHAIKQAGSAVPDEVAKALRSLKGYSGINGQYTFDEKGDVVGNSIKIKVVKNGHFIPVHYEHSN